MTSKNLACLAGIAAFVFGLASGSEVAAQNPKIRIGDSAPDWKDLKGTDDRTYSLADFSNKAVVVVCFTCNSCPYSVDYEDRIIAFQKKYADHKDGVAIVAINANKKPSETLEKMKERASSKNFAFPYVLDETQQVADAYGASFTPEFFVLNRERKVVYMGAMDDKTDATQVQHRYLELAVEAALKGEIPEVKEVPARGCAIPYRRSRK
ncbi:MAG: thioredoxin family protein [Planctomycetaceae bacterium]|nr:thioredoxin family protein [Planctomycetaceae bacterium]